MDDRELLKLARQAGFATDESDCPNEKPWFRVHGYGETLAKFAALVAAAERERCALSCERIGWAIHGPGREDSEAFDCADAIRARKD